MNTVAFEGVDVRPVDVQVQISSGLPAFTNVGYIIFLMLSLAFFTTPSFATAQTTQDANSPENLGRCYENRLLECSGCHPKGRYFGSFDESAAKLLTEAESNSTLPQLLLGSSYARGIDIEQDYAEAYYWLMLASKRGDTCGASLAEQAKTHLTTDQLSLVQKRLVRWDEGNLGLCWDNRFSLTNMGGTYEEAAKRFHRRAEESEKIPQEIFLGALYAKGFGVPKNYEEAYFWLALAASGGDRCSEALRTEIEKQLTAKRIFSVQGRVLEKILKFAEQGDSQAQRQVAIFHEKGWGVSQDYNEAYFWYSLPVKYDSYDSNAIRKLRDEVGTHLTWQQISAVEKRLKEWRQPNYAEAKDRYYYMKVLEPQDSSGDQVISFNQDMTQSSIHALEGKIINCAILVDLPVGTARGNHSFGGICSMKQKNGNIQHVMVCNDRMVGRFKIEQIEPKLSNIYILGDFVANNCVGG